MRQSIGRTRSPSRARRSRIAGAGRHWLLGAPLVLTCLIIAGSAGGQEGFERDVFDDKPADASTRPDGTRRDFEFIFTLPLLYSSRVVRSTSDDAVGTRGDFHADPDLALKWSHQYSRVKLSALVGATLERYATVREADVDILTVAARAEFTDGRSHLFVPYLDYFQTTGFSPTFAAYEDSLHDLAAGFSSAIGIDRDGKPLAYRDARKPGQSSIKFDVRAGRRLADPAEQENFFVQASLRFSHILGKEWTVEVTPKARARWYDDYYGEDRRDFRLGATLQAIWKPEWLVRPLPGAEINFMFDVQRNFSTLPDKRYTRWEAGPTVTLSHRF